MDAPASSRTRHAYAALACSGFAVLAFGLLRWPIVPNDTDLWYHLNFGRRIATTFAIPSSAWYAFVPSRSDFVDYYWLSQCAMYGLQRAFGATGLPSHLTTNPAGSSVGTVIVSLASLGSSTAAWRCA